MFKFFTACIVIGGLLGYALVQSLFADDPVQIARDQAFNTCYKEEYPSIAEAAKFKGYSAATASITTEGYCRKKLNQI